MSIAELDSDDLKEPGREVTVLEKINELIGVIGHLGVLSVKDYGAVGDGSTDDTAAISSALEAVGTEGGEVFFPPGTYRMTTTVLVDKSNVTLRGTGATIFLDPTPPIVSGTNAYAFLIHCGDDVPEDQSAQFDIVGAIAVGDTSFEVSNGPVAADMAEGLWLHIEERNPDDPNTELLYFDWVQVDSVAGTTVNVMAPFRTAFPGTQDTVQYRRINHIVRNVQVRNLNFVTTDASNALPHIVVGIAREVTIENCTFTSAKGNAIASYRTAELVIRNCHQRSNFSQPTEFAATVGLTVTGCTFATYDTPPDGAQLVLDFGTAFFSVTDNNIGPAGNIGCMIIYGCHDGVFANNTLDYVLDAGLGYTVGMLVQGCSRILVANNILAGGDGASGTGITVASVSSGYPTVPIVSTDNCIIDNIIKNFTSPYGPKLTTDLYRALTSVTTEFTGPVTIDGRTTVLDTVGTTAESTMTAGLLVTDDTALAANVGGGITFGGVYTGTTRTEGGSIKLCKTNATDGNYSFDLTLNTRTSGSNVAERVRIKNAGDVWLVAGQILAAGVTYGLAGASEDGFLQPYNPATGKFKIEAAPSFGLHINGDGSAPTSIYGLLTSRAALCLSSEIAPSQLVANADNYNPTGLLTATFVYLTSDASRDITGLAGGTVGRRLWLYNGGAQNIVLKHKVTSTAANQICGRGNADTTLTPGTGVELVYSVAAGNFWLIAADTL